MPPVQLWVAIIEVACLGAMLGLAFLLVDEVAGGLNFAIGGFAMLAPVIVRTISDGGTPLLIAYLIAVSLTAFLAWISDIAIGRPIERRSGGGDDLPMVIAFAALLFTISQGVGWLFGRRVVSVPKLLDGSPITMGGATMTRHSLLMIVIVICTFVVFSLWRSRGKLGKQMVAVGDNPVAADLVGIQSRRIRSLGFVTSGAIAALGGSLFAAKAGVGFDFALEWSLVGFLAYIVGGKTSTWAPLLGAVIVAAINVLTAYYFGGEYVDIAMLVLALVFFAFRPSGLFATRVRA